RDMLYAALDGMAQCRGCGRLARLDLLSRWMISCVLAILLPNVLLYGGLFYSGHLFVISIVIIYGAWALLSFFGFPFLTLEAVASDSSIDRPKSILLLAVLLVAAIVIDSFIASKIESDNARDSGRSASAALREG
ncbi:MAG: hypothetical protein QOK44_4897, partial [Betaproteobacteria bacterium]|nr:hypothetical protein [Betaproteobacteria bacterium]